MSFWLWIFLYTDDGNMINMQRKIVLYIILIRKQYHTSSFSFFSFLKCSSIVCYFHRSFLLFIYSHFIDEFVQIASQVKWTFTFWWWYIGLPRSSTTCTHNNLGTNIWKAIYIDHLQKLMTFTYETTWWAYAWFYGMHVMWGILCSLTMGFQSRLRKISRIHPYVTTRKTMITNCNGRWETLHFPPTRLVSITFMYERTNVDNLNENFQCFTCFQCVKTLKSKVLSKWWRSSYMKGWRAMVGEIDHRILWIDGGWKWWK